MRKAASLATAMVTVALALFTGFIWLNRLALPYNEEGRFFDADQSVVYTDSAIPAYALLTLLFAALAVAAVLWTARAWRR